MFILETDRLIIRRFQLEDWMDLYDYLSREEVVRFEPYNVFSEEECVKEAARRTEMECFLAVCLKETEKLVGNIYFQQEGPKEFLTWELGYVFNLDFWGKGYATESCRRIMDFAFADLYTRRITAMCNTKNERSWKLLERLGMRREGHFIKNVHFKFDENKNPLWNDSYAYAILAEEWILRKEQFNRDC